MPVGCARGAKRHSLAGWGSYMPVDPLAVRFLNWRPLGRWSSAPNQPPTMRMEDPVVASKSTVLSGTESCRSRRPLSGPQLEPAHSLSLACRRLALHGIRIASTLASCPRGAPIARADSISCAAAGTHCCMSCAARTGSVSHARRRTWPVAAGATDTRTRSQQAAAKARLTQEHCRGRHGVARGANSC